MRPWCRSSTTAPYIMQASFQIVPYTLSATMKISLCTQLLTQTNPVKGLSPCSLATFVALWIASMLLSCASVARAHIWPPEIRCMCTPCETFPHTCTSRLYRCFQDDWPFFFTWSEKRLDLVPLVSSPAWQFDQDNTWHLPGAHGDEVVRSVFLDEQVCLLSRTDQLLALRITNYEWNIRANPFSLAEKMAMYESGSPLKMENPSLRLDRQRILGRIRNRKTASSRISVLRVDTFQCCHLLCSIGSWRWAKIDSCHIASAFYFFFITSHFFGHRYSIFLCTFSFFRYDETQRHCPSR